MNAILSVVFAEYYYSFFLCKYSYLPSASYRITELIHSSGFSQCNELITLSCSSVLVLQHQSLPLMFWRITSWRFCYFKSSEWPVASCLFCSTDQHFHRTHCRYDCECSSWWFSLDPQVPSESPVILARWLSGRFAAVFSFD